MDEPTAKPLDSDESWEVLREDEMQRTARMAVPGGWLYCVAALSAQGYPMNHALQFVPDPRNAQRVVFRPATLAVRIEK